MDRIRLSNGVHYPFVDIETKEDDLLITFYKTVEPKTIKRKFLDILRVEDRKGNCLSVFKGYNTVIRIIGNKMQLRKCEYSDNQIAQQSITDSEIETIESQQEITDAYIEDIAVQQDSTDMDIECIESEQDSTESDLEQIEQGQTLTEYELELMELI